MTVIRTEYDGKVLRPDPDAIREYKATLQPGDVVAMTLEPWEDARTRRQQGLLHELLGRYARHNNESLESCKIGIKVDLGYYLPADKLLDETLDFPPWRGSFVDLHAVRPDYYGERTLAFLRSESTYTKQMEGEFIDTVIARCGEVGVNIDDILESIRELRSK
jgi:hypothetical protein